MDLDVSNDDYDTDEVSARTAAHLAASDVTMARSMRHCITARRVLV